MRLLFTVRSIRENFRNLLSRFASGQLECDVILPASTGSFPSGEQLAALLEQPRGHDLTVYERGADNVVINIGTASLVWLAPCWHEFVNSAWFSRNDNTKPVSVRLSNELNFEQSDLSLFSIYSVTRKPCGHSATNKQRRNSVQNFNVLPRCHA